MISETRFRDKTVLVTGANGFIGSHLTRKLLGEGAKVHVLLKANSNQLKIQDIIGNLEVWQGDITDLPSLHSCIRNSRPKIIFHLAALRNVQRRFELIDPVIDINLKGTVNLLRAVVEENVSLDCFINTGSSEEYGDGKAPFREEQREMPVSPYSASKVATTYFCQMLHKTSGIPIVTLRPFLAYGSYQDADMFVPSLISHCIERKDFPMTLGDQTRDFIYIDDVIDAYLLAACTPKAIGEVINIGSGIEHRVRDVAEKIVTMMGNPIRLLIGAIPKRPGETERFFCNNEKAKKFLGWSPKANLNAGLEKTIDWYNDFFSKNTT